VSNPFSVFHLLVRFGEPRIFVFEIILGLCNLRDDDVHKTLRRSLGKLDQRQFINKVYIDSESQQNDRLMVTKPLPAHEEVSITSSS
jgi:hypothetical protein